MINSRIAIILFLIFHYLANAESAKDTVRVYQLGNINIIGSPYKSLISKSNISNIDYITIQKTDAISLSELQILLPSGRIKTNSRGEYLLFLRGAGERQLGLFFDGVPMNVLWDNRFDLSLLPLDIVGQLDIDKNASSIAYGPNVLGGAVNISTYERSNNGLGGKFNLMAGEAGMMKSSLTLDGRKDKFNYIASINYSKTHGSILPASRPDSLLNQNLSSRIVSNSFKEFLTLYSRAEYEFSDNDKLGISLMHINGEKGVSPENHIPENSTRFWTYPYWNRSIITANGQYSFDKNKAVTLRTTAWLDIFNQTIDSYTDNSYSSISQSQKDNDFTLGTRVLLNWNFLKDQHISYVFNWYNSSHEETINSDPTMLFSQNIVSTGITYNLFLMDWNIKTGFVFDYFATGKAGNFSDAEGNTISDYGYFLDTKYAISDNSVLFGNFSRRTRFPTMRESYSGALDRFKINPEIKPETGLLGEIGLNFSNNTLFAELSVFANQYDDLIEQIRLSVQEDSLRRRMRVNYSEATVTGIDATLRIQLIRYFGLQGNLTLMASKGKSGDLDLNYLNNRPDILSSLILNYTPPKGINIQLEMETTGRQFELDPNNNTEFIEIGRTTIFNTRISYSLPYFYGMLSEIFIRVNNIADTYRLYQLGLPEPGRTFYGGIAVNF